MSLFILDTHALMYRAHYAMERQYLHTKSGFPTGSIYGMTQYLTGIKNSYNPENWAAVMDPGSKSHRHVIYPAYKDNRKPMPEALIMQLPEIERLLNIFGITVIKIPGYEADDLIASVVNEFKWLCQIKIISKDKDLTQLICDKVEMLSPNGTGKFDVINTDSVVEKFGVMPENIAKWLALVGDSGDNIPGVKGIGPKGAVRLINSGEDLSKKPGFELSLSLTTLQNYPEVIPNIPKYEGPNINELRKFYEEFELNSFLKDLK